MHMIESATTETSSSSARLICGARTALPAQLVVDALALAGPGNARLDEVQAELLCTLEEHTVGAHWGFVMDLDLPDTGSVWTPWTGGFGPSAVVVLPDCPAVSTGTRERCGEFAAHPGAHSWEVGDRPDDESPADRARRKIPRRRARPQRLNQEPEAVTWAREKAGLTKRALAEQVGISEQLMGEIEFGWRSATPVNLAKIADALNCPLVTLERKRSQTTDSA